MTDRYAQNGDTTALQQLQEALQEEFRQKYGEMPSSVEDIRQMREERDAEITRLR